jgi:hypothetical protein
MSNKASMTGPRRSVVAGAALVVAAEPGGMGSGVRPPA